MTTQKLLAEGIEKFSQIKEGNLEEEVAVFNSFKKGVNQVSSGPEASPEEVLAPLEPKEPALRALSDIHAKKRMYQKQIEGVFAKLMQVDTWVYALGGNEALYTGLPDELRALHKEATSALALRRRKTAEEVVDTPVEEPADTVPEVVAASTAGYSAAAASEQQPDHASPPVASDRTIRRVVDAARERMEAEKAAKVVAVVKGHTAEDPVELLSQSFKEMKAIDFSAADYDSGIQVWVLFRKAVMQVVNTSDKEDDAVLDSLEPKDLILAFLMELHEKHTMRRSQVKEILIHLWELDLWKTAIKRDGSALKLVEEGLQELAKDTEPCTDELIPIAVPSRMLTCTFKAGIKLGIRADWPTGRVDSVTQGGQAEPLGVEANMFFRYIDGEDYSAELLTKKADSGKDFKISFVRSRWKRWQWVPLTRGELIPTNAVKSGLTESDGDCFVGRHQDQAGKINTDKGAFWNFWAHDTGFIFKARAKTEAEILLASECTNEEWKPIKCGDPIPPVGSVQAGVTQKDGFIYVGRRGGEAGKINTADGKMHRFWGHATGEAQEAEILLMTRSTSARKGATAATPAS